MAASNQFLLFATGGGANVASQADWAIAANRTNGFQTGIAPSSFFNKAWRQSSFVASSIAQVMAVALDAAILDNGVQADFMAQFIAAILKLTKPSQYDTLSATVGAGPFNLPSPAAGNVGFMFCDGILQPQSYFSIAGNVVTILGANPSTFSTNLAVLYVPTT